VRVLYLDDSGKPHSKHPSRCVAYAGFSVDEADWHALVRHVTGAKARHFPRRGKPTDWELKSVDFLTKNAWNRANNRRFAFEVVDILKRDRCTLYAACFDKALATKPLDEGWVVPLAFQRLAAKFDAELAAAGTRGVIMCDWSTHALDRHVSDCVQSFVLTRGLASTIIAGVTYGSSRSLIPIQVCDLVAGAFRMWLEGARRLDRLVAELNALRFCRPGVSDALGLPVDSVVNLFRRPAPAAANSPHPTLRGPLVSGLAPVLPWTVPAVVAPVEMPTGETCPMPQRDELTSGRFDAAPVVVPEQATDKAALAPPSVPLSGGDANPAGGTSVQAESASCEVLLDAPQERT